MHWQDRISALLRDHNLRRVCARLGLSKNRLFAMTKQGQCPNAVDALKICWYLNVSIDQVFGDTAEEELRSVDTDDPVFRPITDNKGFVSGKDAVPGRRPPPDHTAHAEAALQGALRQKRDADAKLKRLGSKKSATKKRTG